MRLECGARWLDLGRPCVMGVVNVTPDSFSDGGRFNAPEAAIAQALRLVGEGALVIDVGGESTRPGAAAVATEEEIARVIPVVQGIRAACDVVISVDTSKPEVMVAAVAAGAGLINDVRAFREPGALQAAAKTGAALCVMHMQGEPRTMQHAPRYQSVVTEVRDFLAERLHACVSAGVDVSRLCVDPGFGFGKTLEHNLSLLRSLGLLRELGRPVMVGLSRKSMLQVLTGRPVQERLSGSIALAALAALNGASIVRAHDVAATVDALRVIDAYRGAEE
jgi:dihydropteroate synthase